MLAKFFSNFSSKVQQLYSIVLFFSCIAVPVFTRTPKSVNATLGYNATFNCSVTSGFVTWIVNGTQLSELNLQDITAYQIQATFCLTVPAVVEYNNTVVVCSAVLVGRGNYTYSVPAVLRIQGMSCICKICYTIRGLQKKMFRAPGLY